MSEQWNKLWQERKDNFRRSDEIRSPFHIDRGRILHSASFRRLQSKTQVHQPLINDFNRTRLTHSLEVAQISTGICLSLENKYKEDIHIKNLIPDNYLIESLCLAHDIGHPPFGHGGEKALNNVMYKNGGFEGNAQTFRIVTFLEDYTESFGMNLTRRTLLGLIKYPVLIDNYPIIDGNNYLRKGIYSEDADYFNWILEAINQEDIKEFQTIVPVINENKIKSYKTIYKSFDSSIMEIADDITYAVHDMEDALQGNLIEYEDWQKYITNNKIENKFLQFLGYGNISYQKLGELIFQPYKDSNSRDIKKDRKKLFGSLIYYLIVNIEIKKYNKFSENLLDYYVDLVEEAKDVLILFKKFVRHFVIDNPLVKRNESIGGKLIDDLFYLLSNPKLWDNTNEFFDKRGVKEIKELLDNKDRVICDYISGMSNTYINKIAVDLQRNLIEASIIKKLNT